MTAAGSDRQACINGKGQIMTVKDFLKTTKGKVIAITAGVLVVAGIVTAVLLMNGNTYRSIIAKGVSGNVNVVGDINNGQAYTGERLYGGDDISVMENSSLTMLMDNDKYLHAEQNTHFLLKAEQSDRSSRIRIVLDKGSELNELQSKLGYDDSYDVDTPNSTMSVRGTEFRVTVYTEGDVVYTLLEVSRGVVLAQLRTLEGTYTGVEKNFYAGESVLIRGGRDFSEFVTDENGDVVRHLDLSTLPTGGTDRLIALLGKASGEKTDESGTEPVVTTEAPSSGDVTDAATENNTQTAQDPTKSLIGWLGDNEDTTAVTEAPESGNSVSGEVSSAGITAATEAPSSGTAGVTAVTSADTSSTTRTPVTGISAVTNSTVTSTTTIATTTTTAATTTTTTTAKATSESTSGSTSSETVSTEDTSSDNTLTPADHTHTFGAWNVVKASTCTGTGREERRCTVCGYTESRTIPAAGHKYGAWTVTNAADCENAGTETRTCTVCGNTEERTIAAAGHKYGEWTVTKAADCENAGTETRTCTVCGKTEDRTIAAAGHKYGAWTVTRAADCETEGTETRTCTVCGKTEENTIAATGHKYGAWEVVNEADCVTDGLETRVCTVCRNTEERIISATGHNYVKGDYDRNAGGYIYTCTKCKDTYIEKAPDPNQTNEYPSTDTGGDTDRPSGN